MPDTSFLLSGGTVILGLWSLRGQLSVPEPPPTNTFSTVSAPIVQSYDYRESLAKIPPVLGDDPAMEAAMRKLDDQPYPS